MSLFNDTTSELICTLVPLFLASVLLAGPAALGVIDGIAEATGSLLKLFSRVLTDRFGHARAWVVTGYALAALSDRLGRLSLTPEITRSRTHCPRPATQGQAKPPTRTSAGSSQAQQIRPMTYG